MKLINFSLVILSFIRDIECEDCENVLSRPNIYKMSDADRNRYFNAVRAINSGSKPTEWDKFAQIHVKNFPDIHNRPLFEAWHRKYTAELEKLLRKNDTKIRIPYWDWSQYYNDRNNDPIWKWFGKEGSSNGEHCIIGGEFKDFKVFFGDDLTDPGRVKCLTRKSKIDAVFGCHKDYINQRIIDERNARDSWIQLEYNCHNSVHDKIGEGFGSLISTNDPLFFSHHAFVDMIWFVKQMRYPSEYDKFAQSIDDKIPGYNIPIRDVLDATNLCYTYLEDNYSWLPPSNTNSIKSSRSSSRVEPFQPLIQINRDSGSISDERIENYARNYVFKNITSPINKSQLEIIGPKCKALPLRDITSIKFIRMMNSNETLIRELERSQALFMENLNKKCL
jgi:hypothetical protein